MPTNSVELWKASCELQVTAQTSIEQARAMGTPALSAISKEAGQDEVLKFIKANFLLLTEYFGVTWSDSQIQIVSEDFYQSFFHWKIADIKKFTQNCRTLQFGKNYGAFSPAMLMQWAIEYNIQWLEVSEKLSESKHGEFKERGSNEEIPILKLLKNKL